LGREQVLNLQTGIALLEAKIQEHAQQKPDDAAHSRALEEAAKYVKGLDESLRNAIACRKDLLKILDYFCSPADQDTEIPAADCNKIKTK
jgi:hypothetical protein